METAERIGTTLIAGAIAAFVMACTPGAADEVIPEGDRAPLPETRGGDSWTASSTSGVEVRISVDPLPLRPGPARLEIALAAPPPEVLPLSVDLVSPEMPMHGIVRYEAEASSAARYHAVVEIPMEGFWELYVNLDYGADAAVFELDVPAPAGSGSHLHHGPREAADADADTQKPHDQNGASAADSDGAHEHHSSGDGNSGRTSSTGSVHTGSHAGHDPR